MRIYTDNYKKYLDKDLNVIPDKPGTKLPAVKGWSRWATEKLPELQAKQWATTFNESNISLMLGKASGIVAIDFDSDNIELYNMLKDILPTSPVEKKGDVDSIKFTRFFRYSGELTDIINLNGECVLELLSTNKKTTLPPSIHPKTKKPYIWSGEKELLDVNLEDLPVLEPTLFARIREKLAPLQKINSIDVTTGRNNYLKKEAANMVRLRLHADVAITRLIELDKQINNPPLFTDKEEFQTTDPIYNAQIFYFNMYKSINDKRIIRGDEPEVAHLIQPRKIKVTDFLDKSKSLSKKLDIKIPDNTYLKQIHELILSNSIKKQPELALGASFSVIAALAGQHYRFQNITPNIYLLNISKSGTGKQAPQEVAQKILVELNEGVLGKADYASDTSVLKSLERQPVRLDIIDEAGGFFRSATKGRETYQTKMGDILAELYTQANSTYLGKEFASDDKGAVGKCYRPHVSILASTTPAGFKDGLNIAALEKGLLGRFMLFFGREDVKGRRLKESYNFSCDNLEVLAERFKTNKVDELLEPVRPKELSITKEADEKLDELFDKYQNMMISEDEDLRPVVNRLYTHMVKLTLLTALSKFDNWTRVELPEVEFAAYITDQYFDVMKEIIRSHLYHNENEKNVLFMLEKIKEEGLNGITRKKLWTKTRRLSADLRVKILTDLRVCGEIKSDTHILEDGTSEEIFYYQG